MSLMTGGRRPLATSPGIVPPRGHGLVMSMDDEELSTSSPSYEGAGNEREVDGDDAEERRSSQSNEQTDSKDTTRAAMQTVDTCLVVVHPSKWKRKEYPLLKQGIGCCPFKDPT